MAITQKAYYIPDDLAVGVATGLYKITGGVIRYAVGPNKGQIVKHLREVPVPIQQKSTGKIQAGLHIIKQNKKAAMVIGAVAGIGTVGAIAYTKLKSREPEVLTEFRAALGVYIDAIRNAKMSLEIIDCMSVALDNLRGDDNYEKYSIQLTTEEISVLIGNIERYTMQLASDNNIEIADDQVIASDDAIINFKNYLDIQRGIFSEAA